MTQKHTAALAHNGHRVYLLCGSWWEQTECWQLPRWSQRLNDDIHQALSRLTTPNVGFWLKPGLVERIEHVEGRTVCLAILVLLRNSSTTVLKARWSTSAEMRTRRKGVWVWVYFWVATIFRWISGHESQDVFSRGCIFIRKDDYFCPQSAFGSCWIIYIFQRNTQ